MIKDKETQNTWVLRHEVIYPQTDYSFTISTML